MSIKNINIKGKEIFILLSWFKFLKSKYTFCFIKENEAQRTSNKRYFFTTVTIKNYYVVIDGRNFFYYPVENDRKAYDSVTKIATGPGDDYTTCCLLHHVYFKHCYNIIAIDLCKQQALDADPKASQQIDFTGNLDWAGNTAIFFFITEEKETILDFSKGLWEYYKFILVWYNINL